ncbi:type III secretion system HrpP C-terminal domain-containing protein [Billgrantia sp. Q4P2]|uniref:type III secretion system HrpP C-terminal domain-containing protein n=1 Tax=Billgrantia sp. Q4P2 TaxID=3463857 RepID=UPI0040569770
MNRPLMAKTAAADSAVATTDDVVSRPANGGAAKARREASDADAMLFSHLLMPPLPANAQPPAIAGEEGRPPSGTAAKFADVMIHGTQTQPLDRLEHLVHERLDDGRPDIECTLLLPRLGEVRLNASLQQDDWHIDLTFLHAPALAYARRHHSHLAQRLSDRLGRQVILGLHLRREDSLDD